MRIGFTLTFAIDITGNSIRLTGSKARKIRDKVRNIFSDVCYYCGEEAQTGHIEHKIPLAIGGTNDLDNLVWSCADCNLSKGTKTSEEFIAKQNNERKNQIIEKMNQGKSSRQIQLDVFGYAGGSAHDAVKRVCDEQNAQQDCSEVVVEE